MRVLVVEDEPSVRHVIDRLLTPRGHHVLTAPNAGEAAALLIDYGWTIDVALVDVVLPGTSGLVYAEELRRRYPRANVVLMTGWLEPDKLNAARQRGPVLLKPFTAQTLIATTEATSSSVP